MTEAEWLASTDPAAMLAHLRAWPDGNPASGRKLRLFCCACCRLNQVASGDVDQYETGEKNLFREDSPNDVLWAQTWATGQTHLVSQSVKAAFLRDLIGNPWRSVRPLVFRDAEGCVDGISPWLTWRNGTVPKIAQAIYVERRFDLMPALGDALEDAGCDNWTILNHCRWYDPENEPHCRGCWVLDLLTNRS